MGNGVNVVHIVILILTTTNQYPLFSYIFLSIPIYWNTAVAVAIVSYAVVLYARNRLPFSEARQ